MTSLNNITVDLLEKCAVNQLFVVGDLNIDLESNKYFTEKLDIENVNTLRYLVGLINRLEI